MKNLRLSRNNFTLCIFFVMLIPMMNCYNRQSISPSVSTLNQSSTDLETCQNGPYNRNRIADSPGCELVYSKTDPTKEPIRVCFKISTHGRIINGVDARLEDHPWAVFIKFCSESRGKDKKCEFCTGSIISETSVLTAKHCVAKQCRGTISYGSVDKNDGDTFHFRCISDRVISNKETDLAIIQLAPGQVFKKSRPIAIPYGAKEQPEQGDAVFAVGWGLNCDEDGLKCDQKEKNYPDTLKYVKIHVAADGMCDYPEDQFCAGGPDEKGYFKDSCTGDSGGPLECMDSKKRIYLCGVVSKGPEPPHCGKAPGSYSRIARSSIITWLKKDGNATSSSRMTTAANEDSEHRMNGGESTHFAIGWVGPSVLLTISLKR